MVNTHTGKSVNRPPQVPLQRAEVPGVETLV